MRCSKCHHYLGLIQNFCPKCGTVVTAEQKKRGLITFGIFVLLFLAFIPVIYYYTSDNAQLHKYSNLFNFGMIVFSALIATEIVAIIYWIMAKIVRLIKKQPVFGSMVVGVVLILVGMGFYLYGGRGPVTMPDNVGVISGAIFSNRSEAAPVAIEYPINKKGKTVRTLAYPGEINLFVKKGTSLATVENIVKQYNGKILTQIPKLGFYMIGVDAGSEASIIQKLINNQGTILLSAVPNLVVHGSAVVDLSGTGKTNPREIVTALISTPDPNAKVIVAQLDNFVPLTKKDNNTVNIKNYDSFGSSNSHGAKVYDAMKSVLGNTPVMQVHVGGWPCDRMPAEYCSSAERTVNALAATIAGAEINGQKVTVNLSYNAAPQTTDPKEFAAANLPNSWAAAQWQGYEEQLYGVLKSSDWAKNGKVILNQSAGNGVKLVDKDGNVLDSDRLNVSGPINNLKQKYPEIQGAVGFYGALNAKTGALEEYSNYGTGVTFVKLLPNSPPGTSFAAPLATAVGFKTWTAHDFGPNVINDAVRATARKTAEFQNFDAVTKAWFYRYVENLEENRVNAAALEKKLNESTKKLIEVQSQEQADQSAGSPSANPFSLFGIGEPVIPEPPPVDINDIGGQQSLISDCERWGPRVGETCDTAKQPIPPPPVIAPLVPSGSGGISPPPNFDIDNMDVSGQTTDPCRWGGPGCP